MSIRLVEKRGLVKRQSHDKAHDFIAAGVVCYAFTLIDGLGLLDQLLDAQGLSSDFFHSYANPLAVRAAIQTLQCNDVVFLDKNVFRLTPFGKSLVTHLGSIKLIYSGYCKVLANQMKIVQDQPSQYWDLADDQAISKASAHMCEQFINHRLLAIIKKQSIQGTICDLGCGDASTLLYLCRKTKLPGLGFDLSSPSIHAAKSKCNQNDKITLQVKDITTLSEIYLEVEMLILSFVMHDFSMAQYQKTLASLLECFPNVKVFVLIDAVASEDENPLQLPGFDYLHGLLGIRPRTLEETTGLLIESEFIIVNREPITELPNCYIWTLSPKNEN